MQTTKQSQSRTVQQADDEMQKTGIQSIDKFFNYGEKVSGPLKIQFVPIIHQVIDMFQSEYTESLHDRKAKAIIKLCEERSQGFFYQEVQGLTKLFQYAKADLDRGVEEMIPALQQILSVDCIDPTSMFNRNASSDQLRYISKVPSFLTSLE